MKRRRKPTGEKKIFKEIWEEREHRCINCLCHLGDEARVHYFSHIKGKGAYPELRLDKSNIQLLCMECHYAFDHQGSEYFLNRKNLYGTD